MAWTRKRSTSGLGAFARRRRLECRLLEQGVNVDAELSRFRFVGGEPLLQLDSSISGWNCTPTLRPSAKACTARDEVAHSSADAGSGHWSKWNSNHGPLGADARCHLDVEPTDLAVGGARNDAAEVTTERLRPEADTEDRHPAALRVSDELELAPEPRRFDLVVVDRALGTQDDQDVVTLERRRRRRSFIMATSSSKPRESKASPTSPGWSSR